MLSKATPRTNDSLDEVAPDPSAADARHATGGAERDAPTAGTTATETKTEIQNIGAELVFAWQKRAYQGNRYVFDFTIRFGFGDIQIGVDLAVKPQGF